MIQVSLTELANKIIYSFIAILSQHVNLKIFESVLMKQCHAKSSRVKKFHH